MSGDPAHFRNDVRQKVHALTKLTFSERIGTIETSLWVILQAAYLDFVWVSLVCHIWNYLSAHRRAMVAKSAYLHSGFSGGTLDALVPNLVGSLP